MPLTTIRVCWVAMGTLPSDNADGSTEYWIAADAQSPLVRYSSGLGGHVVDVTGAGGGEQHEHRPLQRAGPVDLGQQPLGSLVLGVRGLQ